MWLHSAKKAYNVVQFVQKWISCNLSSVFSAPRSNKYTTLDKLCDISPQSDFQNTHSQPTRNSWIGEIVGSCFFSLLVRKSFRLEWINVEFGPIRLTSMIMVFVVCMCTQRIKKTNERKYVWLIWKTKQNGSQEKQKSARSTMANQCT